MNLTPKWIAFLESAGYEVIHWSSVGPDHATDREIMQWARKNRRIVLTSDLDFGAALATFGEKGPSVVQLRTSSTLPDQIGQLVLSALRRASSDLVSGALLTIDRSGPRLRTLPFGL
jgi:predicted nuclease of predicted toxin-antitoxin system